MKLSLSTLLATATLTTALPAAAPASDLETRAGTVQGFDISHYQGTVNFKGAYASGARFVIIKATEGNTYLDPSFSSHYTGATNANLIRGGYHFAHPTSTASNGASQANFFLAHGGGWSGDGRTLPGMLDIEYAPSGDKCWGVSPSNMVAWISSFVNQYHTKTGRWPLIYTTNDWWSSCTGNSNAFSTKSPLVLARYGSSPGTIPGGWGYQTIWQNADSYTYGGDADKFNGSLDRLKVLATG